jgi:hypothetical protein
MARLTDLQRQIDEATEEVRHLTQDEQDRRPQHRELHQEGLFNDDRWYDASPFQQNYELSRGPHHTSHLSFQCMMGIQTQSSF